jgi:uncharacterized protein (DUF1501 family)
MKRREFLRVTCTSMGGWLMLPGFLRAGGTWLDSFGDENKLVFIQLNGGNDGLNTFIPFEDPLYKENRPSIHIPTDKIIRTSQGMGLHPALVGFGSMLQDGNVSILQNVGYPNPNRSHFRSQEIWQTASDSRQYLDHGWLGRFLDIQCKDNRLASLNIDNIDNLALKGSKSNNITLKEFRNILNYRSAENEQKLSDNPQLDFVRKLQWASAEGMEEIQQAIRNAEKFSVKYANNPLSKNLEWIGKLIKGNLASNVFYTSLNGFDTHNNQLAEHQKQLTILNDAVFSFYNDMKQSNLLNRVTIVIFSEFGRRVKQNGSGTDHGTAGPMFIIGGGTKGNIIGNNPNLQQLDKGDLIHDLDFRSVYATLLKHKFSFDAEKIGIINKTIDEVF